MNLSFLFYGMLLLLVSALAGGLTGGRRRLAGRLNLALTGAAALFLTALAARGLWQGEPVIREVSFGFGTVPFLLDSFSAVFLVLISLMGALTSLYSIRYMDHYEDYGSRGYYVAFPLFLAGMVGVVTVDDLSLGFTIFWQLMTLASFYLVRYEFRNSANVRAANKYLVLMEVAWLAVLAGVLMTGAGAWGDPVHAVRHQMESLGPGALLLTYALLLFGFAMKAGIFPLGQFWLPDAHSVAPSPVSALLSGVMLKTGIYGICRTFFWMVPENASGLMPYWGVLIAALGTVTLFVGTAQSLKQSNAKRLLAYSSIGQIGYIVLGIGLVLVLHQSESPSLRILALTAAVGVLYHIANHAVFKGLLFLSSGSLLYATGEKDLNRLGGLMGAMPLTALCAGVASLAISGVPSLSGFASKWSLISPALLGGDGGVYLVLFGIVALFTSALTLACYVKFFGMSFSSSGAEWNVAHTVEEVPSSMLASKLLLSGVCLLQGLFPAAFYFLFMRVFETASNSTLSGLVASIDASGHFTPGAGGIQVSVPGEVAGVVMAVAPFAVLLLFAAAASLGILLKRSAGSEERAVPRWLCGYQEINNMNRYMDRNMFAAIKRVLRWTGGNLR